MSKRTRFMSKLFSDSTPSEYKEMIAQAVDTAKDEGNAMVVEDETGDELLLSAIDGGDVIVEDYNDGDVEKTLISSNPEDENDLVLTAVEEDTPAGSVETGTVETKTESEDQNLKSVEIEVLPGKGTEPEADLVDDLEIEVDPDVEGTQRYSLHFKNFSEHKAKMIAKLFGESCEAIENLCNCDVSEDVQVKFDGDKMKCFSIKVGKAFRTFSEADDDESIEDDKVSEVEESAEALTDKVDSEGINEENADEIKTAADDLIVDAERVECYSRRSMSTLKSLMKIYSDAAAEVIESEEMTDENDTKLPDEDAEKLSDEDVKEISEDMENEIKTKTASEPSVTVTIENLEPASVADLLGNNEDKEEKTDVEPRISPNSNSFGEGPRSFSLKDRMRKFGSKESINPLLETEIY